MMRRLFLSVFAWMLLFVSVVSASFTVYTVWHTNMGGYYYEVYHCTDSSCSGVDSTLYNGYTGSSTLSLNLYSSRYPGTYDYFAFYFFKECYLPMEFKVWANGDSSLSHSFNFIKRGIIFKYSC